MKLNTAAEVISFSRRLEEDSARFYEALAQRYAKDGETMLALARENEKNIVQIERAYYGAITDALEGGFAFNLNPEEYTFPNQLPPKASYAEVLHQAVAMEEKVKRFYSDAAEQSKSLMADVPRALARVAGKRDRRISLLKSLGEP